MSEISAIELSSSTSFDILGIEPGVNADLNQFYFKLKTIFPLIYF